ncbi:PAS domain-containing protein [Histidinibacterium aquaticum]|uniref:PAS domain-containing protein n=1 Tax=Histidinibacterium aquaticum TaxID=2613962 RepID=A0A5J5GLL4_9RHOB|nr:PAS domain-containing protein [Histidinibacterium aquaticum]KAA9009189.1 PAS domain-containing protein [Histidinibacterium aquaticum]
MTDRPRTDGSAAPDPALRQMERYWTQLRGDRRLPQRRDVDPSKIEGALPWAFMMQRIAPGVGRVRVAGQRLEGILGTDPRGLPLTAFFAPSARETVTEHLTALFDDPAIAELPVVSRRGIARPHLSGRLLLLPLIGDDGLVSASLGALVVDGEPGSTPRRFEIGPGTLRCERVRSARYMEHRARIVDELDEARRPDHPPPHHGGRPRLRLVVDNTR